MSAEFPFAPKRDRADVPSDRAASLARQLESVCNNATLALFIMDERQRCTYMNPAAEQLTGYTLAEVRERPLHELIHHTRPDGRPYPIEECPIDRARPTRNRQQGEEVFVHKDGHFYPVAFTASPMGDGDQAAGTVIEVRDLTVEKKAERTERDLLRLLFDAMPQLGWTALPDGYIDYYNRGWYEYTGAGYEAMKGWGWTSVHHPDELPRVMESWARAIATGKPWELEFPLRRRDGVYRWFLSRATPIYDDSGRLVRWVGINTDIDDQKRAEAELAELDRAKTAFFHNVSHELRTPLTLILAPVEEALRSGTGALAGPTLATVQRNAVRLLKLVNTLLDYARMEAGRAQAAYAETDVARLTREVASTFESAVQLAGLRFEVDCPPAGTAWIDHGLWEKVVLNLLSNALKFTFEGTIGLKLRRTAAHVELAVSDTGVGIPAEELPRLFERFHRVEGARARTQEGSGIGLALVHEIVRLHGGTVEVRSEVGRGSTFTVRIPLGKEHLPADRITAASRLAPAVQGAAPYVQEALQWLPAAAAPPQAQALAERPAVNAALAVPDAAAGARILVADDNADMRHYLQHLLADHWEVEVAADGAVALEAARRRRPDLVLADMMMPNLDGFGLLGALRADPALRSVPVLFLSAHAGEEARVEGLRAGADDYLVKPFSARELVARVSTHLQLARLRATAERERRRLELFIEYAPAAIAMFDRDLRYLAASRRWRSDYRLSGEIVGRSHYELFPELPERWKAVHRRALAGEVVSAAEDRYERPDGSVQWLRWEVRPWLEAIGSIGGIVIAAEDITDRVRAAQAIEAARREAEAANRAKDEFLAMLGHELRNPLAPIVTALDLMRLRGEGAGAQEREVIDRQVRHLVRLVDDLLDVSRIAQGKIDLARQPVELSEVVAKGIELASPLIEKARHSLELDVAPHDLVVDVDAMRMAQVVSNLLTNAAKYTPPAGRIEVAARRDGDTVALRVTDNGKGIAPDLLPRLFERFVQGPQGVDRSMGGLGLGLAIVRSIVEMHGGRVSAESAGLGRGSTFTVTLPAAATLAERRGRGDARPERPAAAASAPVPAPVRALVVDDNQDAADTLGETLDLHGCQTRVACDAPQALAAAEAFHPEVVLLDLGLPVMDGFELARKLRAGPHPPDLLIAVTGYGQSSDRRRTAAAGFDAHLVKPIDLKRLIAMVDQWAAARPHRR